MLRFVEAMASATTMNASWRLRVVKSRLISTSNILDFAVSASTSCSLQDHLSRLLLQMFMLTLLKALEFLLIFIQGLIKKETWSFWDLGLYSWKWCENVTHCWSHKFGLYSEWPRIMPVPGEMSLRRQSMTACERQQKQPSWLMTRWITYQVLISPRRLSPSLLHCADATLSRHTTTAAITHFPRTQKRSSAAADAFTIKSLSKINTQIMHPLHHKRHPAQCLMFQIWVLHWPCNDPNIDVKVTGQSAPTGLYFNSNLTAESPI